jgi:hypothetical protein
MTMTTDFDASLRELLRAFADYSDARQRQADIPTLARSVHELHKARMAAYKAMR